MKEELKKRLGPFLALLDARFAPLLVVALPQAWVVYQWLDNQKYEFFSNLFAVIGAIGFEAVYVGVIAWAEGRADTRWVRITSVTALVFSALVAVKVYFPTWDNSTWQGQLAGALLHAGFPLLACCYTMTIHSAIATPEQPKPARPAPQIVTSAADGGTVEPFDLRELLDETEPVLVAANMTDAKPKLSRSEIARKAAAKRWEKKPEELAG